MNEWISVKDRLPAHNQNVLCTDGKSITICFSDIGYHNYLFMENVQKQFNNVTHWMQLPELPEDV